MIPLSIAPMMGYTDRHCRFFLRLLTKQALLYTEMVTTGAILHGDRDRHLCINAVEHPLALQLGGADPKELAACAVIATEYGYDEINLNVGCPSDRVQAGRFGLCLLKTPELVAECVNAMQSVTDIPITVKTRTGVDDQDDYEYLVHFVSLVAQAGCQQFIIHARKGWLKGLSPKENRTIPPLDYGRVYRLKQDFPQLSIALNGGVASLEEAKLHLQFVDSVMLGRAAYHNPYLLAEVDSMLFDSKAPPPSRESVFAEYQEYLQSEEFSSHAIRHALGLYHGQPHGKQWRRALGQQP